MIDLEAASRFVYGTRHVHRTLEVSRKPVGPHMLIRETLNKVEASATRARALATRAGERSAALPGEKPARAPKLETEFRRI